MLTFDDFITEWIGKVCDYDGQFGTQCMDIFDYYCQDVLGLTRSEIVSTLFSKNPITLYTQNNVGKYFQKIDNTLLGVPKKGDVFIFGPKVGVDGHICIFVEGNILNFKSFDANWPVGTLPHIQAHNYTGALGWLRFTPQFTDPCADYKKQIALLQGKLDQIRGVLNS